MLLMGISVSLSKAVCFLCIYQNLVETKEVLSEIVTLPRSSSLIPVVIKSWDLQNTVLPVKT